MKVNEFDWTIKSRFSDQLQHSNVFKFDEKLHQKFLLACVLQDRLQDAVATLESYQTPPQSDRKFILFMVCADILFSVIKSFFEDLFDGQIEYPYGNDNTKKENMKFFSVPFKKAFPHVTSDKIPTDDQFFRYLRALSFAHPCKTDHKHKFMAKGEVHYAPFLLNGNNPGVRHGGEDLVGIKVYSNMRDDFSIVFSFSVMKDFLISRYNTLRLITNHIQSIIDKKRQEWGNHKIDRCKSCVDIWHEIRVVYEERHQDTYFIDEVIKFLKTPLTVGYPQNVGSVEKFRGALESITLQICDFVEAFNYEEIHNLIDEIISPRLPDDDRYKTMDYCREKIANFCCNDDQAQQDDLCFGLSCLMKTFGNKWVDIDPKAMTRDEIWLLVSAAWYLEAKEIRIK